MKTKSSYFLIVLFTFNITYIVANPKYYSRMADSEIKRNPESWMVDFATKLKWDYCNGLELQAIYKVWEKTGNQKYFDYVKSYADTIINENGTITGYKPEDFSLDKLNSGKILFDLYAKSKEEKLKKNNGFTPKSGKKSTTYYRWRLLA